MTHGNAQDQLAAAFEQQRPYLRRIAYGTLGSFAEADDVVQEAWLRLQRVDADAILDLRAWLTTVVGRLALDALGAARNRRERYVGPWLPEPLVEELGASGAGLAAGAADARLGEDPADRVTMDERVTTALLVVLERLSPAERSAFVLHDLFGLAFGDVAEIVGRSPAAVRQLAARARRHVEAGTPRFPASPGEHARIVAAFAAAWEAGDVDGLLAVLDPDVVFTSDGGGRVTAARKPLHGVQRVVQTLLAFDRVRRERDVEVHAALETVNGLPGIVVHDGETLSVFSCTIDTGRIVAIDVVRNPEKLRHVPVPSAGPPGELRPGGELNPGGELRPGGEVNPGELCPGGEVNPGGELRPGGEVNLGGELRPGGEVNPGGELRPGGEVNPGELRPGGELNPGGELRSAGDRRPDGEA